MKRGLSILAAGLVAVGAAASAPDFSRYQVILERKPFGEPPPAPVAPRPAPTPPEQSFARTIRITAMFEIGDEGIQVGYVDGSNNTSGFLKVGEMSGEGIELVSADYSTGDVVLRKGRDTVALNLNDSTPKPPGGSSSVVPGASAPRQSSYADRRRAREDARARREATPPPEPLLKGPELQAHLENYQMEVIRQGLPPLPVPLTPEMDAQLVAEGVLPP